MAKEPTIVAMGGGGFSMEPSNPLLDDYILALSGSDDPRVCFVPTASGDAASYIVNFYTASLESSADLRISRSSRECPSTWKTSYSARTSST
jgi:peptidase E